MLTVDRCRELIPGDENYSDDEIKAIRDSLYELGKQQIGLFRKAKNESNNIHKS